MRVATPNDPKLSDGGGLARPLRAVARWWRSFAAGVTDRSRSLQRMVRRCGICLKPWGKRPPIFRLDSDCSDRIAEEGIRLIKVLQRGATDDAKQCYEFGDGYRIAIGGDQKTPEHL